MILEVVLRRFKRFGEQKFDLSGHVILAGPNNCGKTTVLQAIAVWSLALKRWKQLNDFQRHGGAYTRAPISRQAFAAVPLRSYDLLWKDRDYTGIVEIEVLTHSGQRVAMRLEKDSTEQVYVRPRADVLPQVVRDLVLEVAYVATVGGLSPEEPVYQPDYIETLLGRQRPGDVIRNLLLRASQGNQWSHVAAAVQRLFGVELLVPQTPGGQIVCEYRQREGSPSFDLLSAGSGFQQVVLLLACLFTRSGSVILVDEPDAHLHVFLQDTIFSELRRAAAETKSQMIIATHSEVIFNSAEPEQICVMMGSSPRRLASDREVERLGQAVAFLQQSDIVAALSTPGILYLEGYTDLNLLREWARVLGHPLSDYLNRTPFWRPKKAPGGADGKEVDVKDHFDALRLVDEKITGVWLIDADGKIQVPPSAVPEKEKLNRACWSRYETESYLLHPASLARFVDGHTGGGGMDAVRRFLIQQFGSEQLTDAFIANPNQPAPLIEGYLRTEKARTTIISGILQEGGVHGFDYTQFGEIAAQMLPDEIHPEVREKLDFIQKAFGL